MVSEGGVDHFRRFPMPLQQVGADFRVPPFQFVVGRLADIMQQAAAARGQVATRAPPFRPGFPDR
jgi:hypothetical protein